MNTEAVNQMVSQRRALEKTIADLLNDFSRNTGLVIDEISAEKLEVTSMSDDHRRYRYSASIRLSLPE